MAKNVEVRTLKPSTENDRCRQKGKKGAPTGRDAGAPNATLPGGKFSTRDSGAWLRLLITNPEEARPDILRQPRGCLVAAGDDPMNKNELVGTPRRTSSSAQLKLGEWRGPLASLGPTRGPFHGTRWLTHPATEGARKARNITIAYRQRDLGDGRWGVR